MVPRPPSTAGRISLLVKFETHFLQIFSDSLLPKEICATFSICTVFVMIIAIALGTILLGTHLYLLVVVAQVCEELFPNGGLLAFLGLAVLFGLAIIRIQTRLEVFFIERHVNKRPDSWWKYVSAKKQEQQELAHSGAEPQIALSQIDFGRTLSRGEFGL